MTRFDKSYHDVDPATGRAFSFGYPDGVWIIAIIYGLIVFATAVQGLLGVLFSKGEGAALVPVVPFLATAVLYVPAIVFLFRRMKVAVIWMIVLAVLFLAAGIFGGMELQGRGRLGTIELAGIAAIVAAQAYIAFYTYRLRRDALLG